MTLICSTPTHLYADKLVLTCTPDDYAYHSKIEETKIEVGVFKKKRFIMGWSGELPKDPKRKRHYSRLFVKRILEVERKGEFKFTLDTDGFDYSRGILHYGGNRYLINLRLADNNEAYYVFTKIDDNHIHPIGSESMLANTVNFIIQNNKPGMPLEERIEHIYKITSRYTTVSEEYVGVSN